MANGWTQLGLGTLPPGTVVDGWRVLEVLGRGANGTVYGAEPLEPGGMKRCALKLASRPQDLRFEREVELLSRIHHPGVPQLYGHGWWRHPSGVVFAYLAMERMEGVGLYEWATRQARGSGQVLRVLADVISALKATHAAGCVHRDVKGENVLVSPEGHGVLIDFGARDFQGARTLTEEVLPPGTAYYRSPQALRFQWKHRNQPGAHYEPGPADDVYALGVTGYILVTGSAPEWRVDPQWEADPQSRPPPPPLVEPRELATVSAELNALLVRMLSDEPQDRGSTGELATALERAASRAGRKAEVPIVPRPRTRRLPCPSTRNSTRKAMVLAATVGCALLAACAWWHWPTGAGLEQAARGGAVALGDTGSLSAHTTASREPSAGVKLSMPKKPFPGQQLPPCREGFETELELTEGDKDTRSCWLEVKAKAGKCKANGYEYQEGCYVPVYPPIKVPQAARP